jgi:hypothetical protein
MIKCKYTLDASICLESPPPSASPLLFHETPTSRERRTVVLGLWSFPLPVLDAGLAYWYPVGCACWKFHRSLHIVSRLSPATKPSSFSASVGSAVRSGTSPSLTSVVATAIFGQDEWAATSHAQPASNQNALWEEGDMTDSRTHLRPTISYW